MLAIVNVILGTTLVIYSLFEIPQIWVDPNPFLKHISLGTLLIIFGVAFMMGPLLYFKQLFSKEKIKTTVTTWVVTSMVGFYAMFYEFGAYFAFFIGFL